jgi:hypothetical protein
MRRCHDGTRARVCQVDLVGERDGSGAMWNASVSDGVQWRGKTNENLAKWRQMSNWCACNSLIVRRKSTYDGDKVLGSPHPHPNPMKGAIRALHFFAPLFIALREANRGLPTKQNPRFFKARERFRGSPIRGG